VHYSQGKYEVTDNGLVRGLHIVNDMTIADFEKNITDALSSSKTNDTQASSDANYYHGHMTL
jgi:hypothetical protein